MPARQPGSNPGKVALEHGRGYVGIDLNADYLPLPRKRLWLDDGDE